MITTADALLCSLELVSTTGDSNYVKPTRFFFRHSQHPNCSARALSSNINSKSPGQRAVDATARNCSAVRIGSRKWLSEWLSPFTPGLHRILASQPSSKIMAGCFMIDCGLGIMFFKIIKRAVLVIYLGPHLTRVHSIVYSWTPLMAALQKKAPRNRSSFPGRSSFGGIVSCRRKGEVWTSLRDSSFTFQPSAYALAVRLTLCLFLRLAPPWPLPEHLHIPRRSRPRSTSEVRRTTLNLLGSSPCLPILFRHRNSYHLCVYKHILVTIFID
jgi:hypothetical protein